MDVIVLSESLKKAWPGGFIGALLMGGLASRGTQDPLGEKRKELENTLRNSYGDLDRSELRVLEPMKSYVEYYRNFKKTYHVLLQLESVVFKNRTIPAVSPPVEAMFMAELKNQLLTAGHDADTISLPVTVDVSAGGEKYLLLSGKEAEAVGGDMVMRDTGGIISSVLYGPDSRSRITPRTDKALFTVYAPPGIRKSMLDRHFEDIRRYVSLFAPAAAAERQEVLEI